MRGNRVRKICLILLACLVTVSCSFPTRLIDLFDGRVRGGGSEEYQADVDALKTMTRNMSIPGHLLDESQPRTADDFDPNELLIPLDHLALEPGYTLDYYYHVDGLGAYPLLYARIETDKPFESEEAYDAVCTPEDGPEPCEPYMHLLTDGTEDGYFQLALMLLMGNQFYLDWHANYNDLEIVASEDRLVTLIEEVGADSFGYPFTTQQIQAARKINTMPEVIIGEEETSVSVVGFSLWGGFFRMIVTFSTSAPHTILDFTSEVLVEYNCGVMF